MSRTKVLIEIKKGKSKYEKGWFRIRTKKEKWKRIKMMGCFAFSEQLIQVGIDNLAGMQTKDEKNN